MTHSRRRLLTSSSAAAFVVSLALSAMALAGPVVSPGGKPGAAASWTTEGNAVSLKIASAYDTKQVASAIASAIPGAMTKIDGDKVVVTGLTQDKLLIALEKVMVKEQADDVDTMLTNLQNPGGTDEEGSGSSIRATKVADFSEVLGKKEEVITAKVIEVKHAKFPLVFVTVKIGQVPKGLVIAGIKAGAKITVLPRVKSRNGVVNPMDETSKLNLGAWYAEEGDNVFLRLEPTPKDNVWVAAAFDRKTK